MPKPAHELYNDEEGTNEIDIDMEEAKRLLEEVEKQEQEYEKIDESKPSVEEDTIDKVAQILSKQSQVDKDTLKEILQELSTSDKEVMDILRQIDLLLKTGGDASRRVADISLGKLIYKLANKAESKLSGNLSIDDIVKLMLIKKLEEDKTQQMIALILQFMKEVEREKQDKIQLQMKFLKDIYEIKSAILKRELEQERMTRKQLEQELKSIKEALESEGKLVEKRNSNPILKILDKAADQIANVLAYKFAKYVEEDQDIDKLLRDIAKSAGMSGVAEIANTMLKEEAKKVIE